MHGRLRSGRATEKCESWGGNYMKAGGGRPDGTGNTWNWLKTSSGIAQRRCEDVRRRRRLPLPPSPQPYPSTFPVPLPQPTSPTPSHPPFYRHVLCHLAVRRSWAALAPRRPGRSWRTGPRERGIETSPRLHLFRALSSSNVVEHAGSLAKQIKTENPTI